MTSKVINFRGAKEAPKANRAEMKTLIFSVNEMGAWRIPPFQRPLTVNAKVRALSEEIREEGGIIPGVITFGSLKGQESIIYIVDGQHRLEAFRLTGLPEFLADVRHVTFETMADMAEEFVNLQSSLVKMRPDDILRGLESSVKFLADIRKACPFVGYDQIRRGTAASPVVGMSMLLRGWLSAYKDTPATSHVISTRHLAEVLDQDKVQDLIQFAITAEAAWGRDPEYYRLWSTLNMTLCMWIWRRMVKDQDRSSLSRHTRLNIKQFKTALMGLSAKSDYLDWLQGRQLSDRDRGPAYTRIKKIMGAALTTEVKGKVVFPSTAWTS